MKDRSTELHGLMKIPVEALYKEALKEIATLKVELGKLKAEVDWYESVIPPRTGTHNFQDMFKCVKEDNQRLRKLLKQHEHPPMVSLPHR